MASYEVFFEYTLTDVNGDTAQTRVRGVLADTATVAAIATQVGTLGAEIAACSNAKVTSERFGIIISRAHISAGTAPPPADAVYPSVTDGARLSFNSTGGAARTLTIPAPRESDFISGETTVNPSDTNVAALIADLITIADVGGTPNLYQGGVKVARHARRRETRKTL